MNMKKTFSSMKKSAARKMAEIKRKKSVPFHGYTEGGKKSAPLRREGRLVLPVGVQTVLAVVICCGVLSLVGAGIFTSQQMEIQELKAEIRSYVDDGVVPAGAMNDSISLNIESVGGRIDGIQRMLDNDEDNALSNDDIQWIALEINELQIESERLNSVLNDADADESLRRSFNDTVQSPLVTLSETFETMTVNDADIVDTAVENGAAANTGAFKVGGNLEKGIRWIVVVVIVVVFCGVVFLFRHKLEKFLPGGKKRSRGKAKAKAASSSKAKAKTEKAAKPRPEKKEKSAKAEEKDGHEHPFAEEQVETLEEEVIVDEEDFLETMTQMAENGRKTAKENAEIPEPSEEDRITFDSNIATQEEIEEEDDLLFCKTEDDPGQK